MDVLDKLKSEWNKGHNAYPEFSEREIYVMLHKKSSSIVKWILIISVIEFAFWAVSAVVSSFIGAELPAFIEVLDYINYGVLIAFISVFYLNYRKISAQSPVKQLLENIINVRRVVKFYVIYNLCIISFALIYALAVYKDDYGDTVNRQEYFVLATGVVFIVVVFLLIYFIYRLLYGRLLNKLNQNYIELQKIKEV